MSAAERAILNECRRRGGRYEQAGERRAEELEALRALWTQAKVLGVLSESVAEASRVSPATVRMWWKKVAE